MNYRGDVFHFLTCVRACNMLSKYKSHDDVVHFQVLMLWLIGLNEQQHMLKDIAKIINGSYNTTQI